MIVARAVLVGCALLCSSAPLLAQDVVRLASDEWCPYVCTRNGRVDGGFVVEVASKSLGAAGTRVESYLLPLNRAVGQTKAGDIDGVFASPDDARLQPGPVLGYSRACFYTAIKTSWTYRGVWSLKAARLGVIGGYEYDNGVMDEYIVANKSNRRVIDFSYGTNAGATNAKKLLSGRFGVLLEHELVMIKLMSDLKAQGRLRNAGCLEQPYALRIGFSPTHKRSSNRIAAMTAGLHKLEKNGELAQIRERYGVRAIDSAGLKAKRQSLF